MSARRQGPLLPRKSTTTPSMKTLRETKFRWPLTLKRSIIKYVGTVLIACTMFTGCSYFKVNTMEPITEEALASEIQNKKRYIILHHDQKVWHLKNATVDETSHVITGTTETLPANHYHFKSAKKYKRANRFKYDTQRKFDSPIYEIHLYATSPFAKENESVTIPFSSINLVEVYDRHGGATIGSLLGVTAAVAVVVGAVLLATKSSCPFAYVRHGDDYDFVGEIYAGAINSRLERDDYLPLPRLTPVDGSYGLRITNELLERQYTNLAQLMVINHPPDVKVVVDKNGAIQSISAAEAPQEAISQTGTNHKETLSAIDSIAYLFNDESPDANPERSLILTFKKPVSAKAAKLVIHAKNSYWLDYVYGKFNEQMGSYYNAFAQQQNKVPASKQMQWSLEQSIPLSVFLASPGGWTLVDYFNLVGPLASRDLVIPIDLSKVTGEKVHVKLQSGFMFWEIDYAAIDFSGNAAVELTRLSASSAIDEKGEDVSAMLLANDDRYLIQPQIGNAVSLRYNAVESGSAQTVFLHSRGYYEYIREYQHWPDLIALRGFRKKGAFTRFAKEQYDEFERTEHILAALLTQRHEN